MSSTDSVSDALDKVKLIQDHLHIAQSSHKSYVDKKVHDMAYMEGEKVLLKVSPKKGVMKYGKKGKLSPRFIGPIKILERVREVFYRFGLPPRLVGVHLIFHVYMLQKFHEDKSHVLDFRIMQLDENLTYEEQSVAIIDQQV
nr:uncharacterized protein LOC104089151 [Nicotiana tomentosiformis]